MGRYKIVNDAETAVSGSETGTLILSSSTNGVSIDDVKTILQHPGHNDLATLCTESNINPTARYKPFKGGGLGVQTNLWYALATNRPGWAVGDEFNIDGNKHLSARANATFGTLIPALTVDDNGFPNPGGVWTHDAPTGGSNQPYRLSDFNGYIHTPSNCWHIEIQEAPHFLKFAAATTASARAQYMDFSFMLYPYKPDGSMNQNKYYLSLRDIAKTASYNVDNLYIWIAIIADTTSTFSHYKKLYAKRTTQSLRDLFGNNGSSASPILFDFNLRDNFKEIKGGTSDTNPTFEDNVTPTGAYGGLSDITGPFKVQCFIGPALNNDGFVSSIYNVTKNNIPFNNTYGSTAINNQIAYFLSLAGITTGSDIMTVQYHGIYWNTGLNQNYCDYSKNLIANTGTTYQKMTTLQNYLYPTRTYNSSTGETTFTFANPLYVIFTRDNVSYSGYVDNMGTTIYYKLKVRYLIQSGRTYKIHDTWYNGGGDSIDDAHVEVTSGSSNIPLGGTSADNNPPFRVPIETLVIKRNSGTGEHTDGISIMISIETGSSSNNTTEVSGFSYTLGFV